METCSKPDKTRQNQTIGRKRKKARLFMNHTGDSIELSKPTSLLLAMPEEMASIQP
jgi:hypothetical protein